MISNSFVTQLFFNNLSAFYLLSSYLLSVILFNFFFLPLLSLCRPVLAIVEVEIQEVDVSARDNVFQEVSSFQGPLDATVVVSLLYCSPEEKDEFPEDCQMELMQIFETYGTVVLVR